MLTALNAALAEKTGADIESGTERAAALLTVLSKVCVRMCVRVCVCVRVCALGVYMHIVCVHAHCVLCAPRIETCALGSV